MARERKFKAAARSSRGYTLIEASVVLAIAAVMMSMSVFLSKSWMTWSNTTTNQQRMKAIELALTNYQMQHNRLPCPASYTATPAAANYARERSSPCTVGAGTFGANGRAGAAAAPGTNPMPATNPALIIGGLPVRDLNLPDSFRTNSYGFMYTYAVTLSQTSTTTPLNSFGGVINMVDAGGNSILPFAPADGTIGTALYAVIDHGKDGKGTYSSTGTATPTACGGAAQGLDFENCNRYASGRFRSLPFSDRTGATWFDDTAVYGMSYTTTTTLASRNCTVTPLVDSAAGTATGYIQEGYDFGIGGGGGSLLSVFIYGNSFYLWPTHYGNTLTPVAAPATTSPTAAAYCPNATDYVVAGGCTQTYGSVALHPAASASITNAYGGDVVMENFSFRGGFTAYPYQLVPPRTGRPTFNNITSRQGWECNGTTANRMRTQAYAVCCTP